MQGRKDLTSMVNNILHHEIEKVDMITTRMLSTARKNVEGMRRNAPCSKGKEKDDLWCRT